MLYQMLSGRLPFVGADLPEVMYAITNEEPAPLPANLPDWVGQVVKIALTKNPAERFKTAEEMGAALVEPPVTPSPKIQTTHLGPTLQVDVTTVERPRPIALKVALPDRIVLPRSFVEDLNGVPLELILVPGGKFLMGSPKGKGYDTEQPQHEVTVSAFYCGKFPVTQMQWQAVMDNNPSHFKGDLQCPVEMVKWEHAKAFCARLRELTGKHYRLPSESEWEYACRASTTGDYAGKLEEMAWYNKNASDRTHPVGQKKANKFGLHDMHGNVWEWCEDAWHANYLGAPTDGSVWWQSGNPSFRVSRGGAWGYDGTGARSANRVGFVSDDRNFVGLRVVMSTKTS